MPTKVESRKMGVFIGFVLPFKEAVWVKSLVSINVPLFQLRMDGPQFGCLFTFHTLHKISFELREIQNVLCPKHSFFSFLSDCKHLPRLQIHLHLAHQNFSQHNPACTKIKPNTLAYKRHWIPEPHGRFYQALSS